MYFLPPKLIHLKSIEFGNKVCMPVFPSSTFSWQKFFQFCIWSPPEWTASCQTFHTCWRCSSCNSFIFLSATEHALLTLEWKFCLSMGENVNPTLPLPSLSRSCYVDQSISSLHTNTLTVWLSSTHLRKLGKSTRCQKFSGSPDCHEGTFRFVEVDSDFSG